MSATKYIKFNIAEEVRKFLQGRKTRVDGCTLLHILGPQYLETLPTRKETKKNEDRKTSVHSSRDSQHDGLLSANHYADL
jgi:hypothetical protein